MHDPSFMALALIVSEKMTWAQTLDKSLRRRRRPPKKLYICLASASQARQKLCLKTEEMWYTAENIMQLNFLLYTAELQVKRGIIQRKFAYFTIKTMCELSLELSEMVKMRGHNVCFHCEMRKIRCELSLSALLLWSFGIWYKFN